MTFLKKEIEDILQKVGLNEENPGVYFGKWSKYNKKREHRVISPLDNSEICSVSLGDENDYKEAVRSSVKAFEEWAQIPAPKRGVIIKNLSDMLSERKKYLGKIVSIEVGKTNTEGQGEIQEMIDIGYFSTGLGRQLYGTVIASERPEHRLYEQYLPLGTIGVITAFNFPAAVFSWNGFIAATVGDTVLWKPSTKAVLTAVAVMKCITDYFENESLPPVFNLISGTGSTVGEWMSEDKNLPLISFTGSVRTGKKIAKKVSERLGKTILELGGNNCAIVSEKADMKIALKGVAFGALATAGQRCTSTRRVVVNEKIYDEFVSKLTEIYKNAKIGNPLEDGVLIGPLIDKEAVKNYENAIKTAQEQGGRIIYGGKAIDIDGGNYVLPTIIEANRNMAITKEETFAPILYVFKYKTIEEAVAIHNDVPQGLSSAIFTNDIREEEYFLSYRGSDCGIANVNTSTAGAEIGGAFGGEKETGGGRESGSDAWKNYARRQTVTKNYGRDVPLSQGVEFKI